MSSQRIAGSSLRAVGALLLLLGIAHLAATPHIPHLLDGSPRNVFDRAVGPTLLNHVLVGILLLSVGFTIYLAAAPANRRHILAKRILLVNALAVFSLPASLLLFMRRPEYYSAPLFLAGTLLVALISLLTLVAACALFFSESDLPSNGNTKRST